MNNHNEEIINTTHELGEAFAPVEAAGFKEHFGENINGVSLAGGVLVGMGVNKVLDYLDSPENPDGTVRQQKITGIAREGLSGGITGGLISGATTALGGVSAGLAPEIAAGSLGYVVGAESGKLIGKGLKKLGAGKDAQEAGEDIGGGFLGGLAAAGTILGASALTGAEAGSFGGPLGMLIGGGIGILGGTLGFGVSEIVKHEDDIKRGITDLGDGLTNIAKSTGNFFKNLF
jgi:hypothetical protein